MKKAILVVSFGTSHKDTMKNCIEAVEVKIDNAFPEYEVRRAFTSGMIIKKLKKRDNINIDSPEDALVKLEEEGFNEVVVQPLHIIPGKEFGKLKDIVNKYKGKFNKLKLGRPVLTYIKDYKRAIDALKSQLPKLHKKSAVILMGHGTYHPANACYSCLQCMLSDEKLNVYVGTVEGYPEIEDIIPKLKDNRIEEVTLMPYMLVSGDHAKNDMAGEDEDSWKNILESEGFKVNVYLHGLGENPKYQDLFVENVKDAINK
ncbi:sirohydrochlorin cobaltochelatase [Thermohalobacter berrensis]|uniref:Sirohydrochlorin cobaltochelatase n=1 Tax=Thermohalobacter berrensis TaxID=99594 RepID=A0A419SZI2_9FIRM|nr:sirohydrochlorin cobaltochelatase [Thermohalobacter berrensis]RKD30625.1 sirohydrochlorin cobaltochelatase [Thermohalobacter berrensis]